MTKQEHIQYWLDMATRDWDAVISLQEPNSRTTLVFAHWTLEKLSKALWVQEHVAAIPPATDDVAELLAATSFGLTLAQTMFVGRLKAFHDDVVESDPMRPAPRMLAGENYQTLIAQTDDLRQELAEAVIIEKL